LVDLSKLISGGSIAWPETATTKGVLGEPKPGSVYATDTLTVPYENPFNSIMQLTGIAFDGANTAYVTTLAGEVWSVKGIDDGLETLVWKRFASGLNQPVGLRIDPDGMFVLDRGQIYRLHDLNFDGEADYYENYANDFGGYDQSHSHTFGLHRTADGAFHFTQRESILRTGSDQKTTFQGSGVRNCMGIGGAADYFWVAPQEGTWTPASSIIEVHQNEFYGLPNSNAALGTSIATPLCYVPRGIDNSVGGMLEITSERWGPFKGAHVGLSYGSGLHYLILRDATGARPQGAVVPLEGEFLAGTIRGAFHPKDGQFYAVGLDGWGDYSVKDGCFHRVRYLGGPVHKPSGFRVHANGIRVDFPVALKPEGAKVFAHAWNYEYAKRYGSPEFSAKTPGSLGHDRIEVRSTTLLPGAKALFVEMPAMEPTMQLHLRMHLTSEDGHAFKTDLFASPMYPSAPLTLPGLAEPVSGKPTAIALRVAMDESPASEESGTAVEGERELIMEAVGGLQYKQTELTAKPGEALALRFKNTDVMPHNWVLVKPGTMQEVGTASFAMLNDPDAGKKHYVPDLNAVLEHVPVVNAGQQHVLHFRAPAELGDYPYICTFPGHWQAMRGVLVVR
jgi:plastocyanin